MQTMASILFGVLNVCNLPMKSDPPLDWSVMRPTVVKGVEVMRAHFVEHSFDRHSHETWSFGVTYQGHQTFNCRGSTETSTPGNVMVFRPDDSHDGHGEDEHGFHYAMIYVPHERVQTSLQEAGVISGGDFQHALLRDLSGAQILSDTVDALMQGQEALRADALLSQSLVCLFERHARFQASMFVDATDSAWLPQVRDYLEAHYASNVHVDELAQLAKVSRIHLTRSFSKCYGLPPHCYLNNVRLRHAKQQLSGGRGIADVAVSCGFSDQSHLTRRFKGCYGITPGAWLGARVSDF